MQSKYQNEENKPIKIMIVLTPRLVERLDRLAAEKTTSRSALIRQACEALLAKMEPRHGGGPA